MVPAKFLNEEGKIMRIRTWVAACFLVLPVVFGCGFDQTVKQADISTIPEIQEFVSADCRIQCACIDIQTPAQHRICLTGTLNSAEELLRHLIGVEFASSMPHLEADLLNDLPPEPLNVSFSTGDSYWIGQNHEEDASVYFAIQGTTGVFYLEFRWDR